MYNDLVPLLLIGAVYVILMIYILPHVQVLFCILFCYMYYNIPEMLITNKEYCFRFRCSDEHFSF